MGLPFTSLGATPDQAYFNRCPSAWDGIHTGNGVKVIFNASQPAAMLVVSGHPPFNASAITDQSVAEDTAWSFQVPLSAFVDADGDALSYTATLASGAALPGWLSFNGLTRTFSGTPPSNFVGTFDLKVTASDNLASASDSFTLTIIPVNDASIVGTAVRLAAIEVNSGAHLITQAALLAYASDVDSAALTVTGLQIAAGRGALVDDHNGTWTYTPNINDDTDVAFSYAVSDGFASVQTTATLDILPSQASPAIGTPGNDTFLAPTGNSVFHALGGAVVCGPWLIACQRALR